MKQYYPISKGIILLNKNTNTEWRGISPLTLSPSMCVATILPAKFQESYPVRSQYCYIPKNFHNSSGLAYKSEQLFKALQTNAKRTLKVMPSVKYSLDGLKLSRSAASKIGDVIVVVEGIINLTGDIVVKPTEGMNSASLSLSGKSARINLISADQATTNFISSLKIDNFIAEGKPSLTVCSSLTDKMSMTATSIQLISEGATAKVIAKRIPSYYEIKSNFGLTLEIQIGYEFLGKYRGYPSSSNPTSPISLSDGGGVGTKILVGGLVAGSIILCVFVPELAPAAFLLGG